MQCPQQKAPASEFFLRGGVMFQAGTDEQGAQLVFGQRRTARYEAREAAQCESQAVQRSLESCEAISPFPLCAARS